MDRTKLPYRKNCEGYFFLKNKVLAKQREGYIEFPGGGLNGGESAKQSILRETLEETGAKIKNLKKIGVIRFDWGENWAKTEKQKERYRHFLGEEMHLFTGEIEKLEEAKGDKEEPGWKGEKLIEIEKVIKLIEKNKPFPKNMQEYYSKQEEAMRDRKS